MRVHVLLFDAGTDSEGIHSLEISGRTVVLLFENPDDAERYAGLLEAQDFPVPTVEALDREDVDLFCREAGYEARLIESGFVPSNDEERLFMAPPQSNRDVSNWQDDAGSDDAMAGQQAVEPARQGLETEPESNPELDELRRRLEGLL
ncbi:MAG: DUF3110 domain-containing protein [Synechococcus sp.]|jgi:hypothetical protein|uniref:DUF3110 domain-containing protein n=1 Tax=Synechococcus sp. MU1617 TaxID=2508346 RepID=UPI00120F621C|nr:DUF3110 domain-containing protein [Synechococcus sp. MU1617]MBA4735902.1 DUF3110 domain-containing protein [Synechococcus sp.]MCB4388363.1 DUF3110 domain-containing protein [Synechococcus sp. MU1617]RZO00629.1 MAG: DUF3110 domain-containing protein [Synechococcus sp. MED-G134]